VVAGDFNFDNPEEHKTNITDNNFEDIILTKFQSDPGIEKKEQFNFTMPDTTQFIKWRPDKVCTPILTEEIRSQQKFQLDPVDAQKVGWFCIDPYLDHTPE
jgi:hypothetical protein